MKCVLDLEEKVFQVTVKDTGVGIENVEKAMEPMFTTCPELERSGLGFSFMVAFKDAYIINFEYYFIIVL